ncbi:protoporphyrinogen/coproporphyrinogen oxidase [Gleimia hominis]|uniref:protoporphyrinogen/coproporphyrinogen oxidase n=1 Tax=Gleimia hominis TaxID=595468 RepID=UPI000C803F5B|nr:FAD-dependent oxidoreductase [Gleimia hominis]WIK64092.1 FAD-dependent oxidoreductase [Gleimia hominis]
MSMQADIVIVGGGLAGMTAAFEATKQGLRPMVVETRGRPGGLIASAKLAGVPFDIGAESWATRSPAVGELVDELGLETCSPTGRSWIYNQALGKTYPIPEGSLGLPADIDAPEVLTAIGESGVARAKQDLTMDPKVGADCEDMESLVTTRLGEAVARHLVEPVAGGIHTNTLDRLAVDTTVPGLRIGLKETGSLLAATARIARANPGPKVAQTYGGMFRLIEALQAEVVARGGNVLTRHAVTALHANASQGSASMGQTSASAGQDRSSGDGNQATCEADALWTVDVQATERGADPAADPVPTGEVQQIHTDRLVVALPGPQAMQLLSQALKITAWELPLGAPIAHQVLMLQAPELDAGPRGSGLLITPAHGTQQTKDPTAPPATSAKNTRIIGAKAVSHLSYKWGWMREVLPAGRHLLRVSYGRADEPYPQPTVEDALADVNQAMGASISPDAVVGSMLVRWDGQLAPQTPTHRAHVARLQQELEDYQGLAVCGAWVAGSGFAAVVPASRAAVQGLVNPRG